MSVRRGGRERAHLRRATASAGQGTIDFQKAICKKATEKAKKLGVGARGVEPLGAAAMALNRLTAVLLGVAIVSFLAPARAMQPGGAGGMMGGQGMGGGGGNPGGGAPILDLSKNSGMPPGLGGMQAQGQGAGGMPPMGQQAPPQQQQQPPPPPQQQPPQGVAPNAAAQTNTMAAGGMGAAGGLGQATQMGAANMAHSQSASPALQIIPVQQINAQVREEKEEDTPREE